MIFIYNAVMNMEIYGNMADNCRKCIFAKNAFLLKIISHMSMFITT